MRAIDRRSGPQPHPGRAGAGAALPRPSVRVAVVVCITRAPSSPAGPCAGGRTRPSRACPLRGSGRRPLYCRHTIRVMTGTLDRSPLPARALTHTDSPSPTPGPGRTDPLRPLRPLPTARDFKRPEPPIAVTLRARYGRWTRPGRGWASRQGISDGDGRYSCKWPAASASVRYACACPGLAALSPARGPSPRSSKVRPAWRASGRHRAPRSVGPGRKGWPRRPRRAFGKAN